MSNTILLERLEKNYYYKLAMNAQLYQRARFIALFLFVEVGYFGTLLSGSWEGLQSIDFFLVLVILTAFFLIISIISAIFSLIGIPFRGWTYTEVAFSEILEYSKKLFKFYDEDQQKTDKEITNFLNDKYAEVTQKIQKVNTKRAQSLRYANVWFFFATIFLIILTIIKQIEII